MCASWLSSGGLAGRLVSRDLANLEALVDLKKCEQVTSGRAAGWT
jgi:hypothetical protein